MPVVRVFMTALLLAGLLTSHQLQAADVDAVYTTFFSNKAIKGFDAVAYFTQGKPVKGVDEFSFHYLDAEWLFSSEEHMNLFKSDPEAYAPQYGGYCAYAMAEGETVSAEPELWTIYNGKLYLNYSRRINAIWNEDKDSFIAKADPAWASLIKSPNR